MQQAMDTLSQPTHNNGCLAAPHGELLSDAVIRHQEATCMARPPTSAATAVGHRNKLLSCYRDCPQLLPLLLLLLLPLLLLPLLLPLLLLPGWWQWKRARALIS